MQDLGVITSNIRVRRRVHNPASFSMLRNQSRASGGFTYQPREEKKPEPAPVAIVAVPGLQPGKRPAILYDYLTKLADAGLPLPVPAVIADILGCRAEGPRSNYSFVMSDITEALVHAGLVTAWVDRPRAGHACMRVFRLNDGRIVKTPGAPDDVL